MKQPRLNYFRYYDLILAFFVSLLLISNIGAVKLISFQFGGLGHIITDGGAILFPLTYIFDDILTEVYGYSFARRAIWMGFFIEALACLTFFLVQKAPPAGEWAANQAAFETILGFVPRIVLASLIAYLFGEFVNSFVLAKLKIKTKGKQLWLRLIGSTVVGEAFDTTIFCLIAFGGILRGTEMLNYIAVGWIFKVSVEVVLLPVTYRIIAFLKRAEQMDAYDEKSNFTPLKLSLEAAKNKYRSAYKT